jgi:Recombinase
MEDPHAVRGMLVCGVSIELVVEDGTDRAVGQRADLDGAHGGGFQPSGAERPHQPQDAEAGSESLLWVRPLLQDLFAERRGCRTDERGVPADTVDGPVGITAMAGRHVVGRGGVLAVAARSHVHGDSLALDADLHGAAGEPHLDITAREPVRNAVEVALRLDVVVDSDPAHAPLGEDVGFGRQGLRVRLIFQRYLALGSIGLLLADLRERGIVTKVRQLSDGRIIGGIPFTRGPLAYLLRNRFYIGEVVFRGQICPGEHPPILDRGLFDAVQQRLVEQRNGYHATAAGSEALLTGRIFDDRGNRMSPSHSRKGGAARYGYYVPSTRDRTKFARLCDSCRNPLAI